MAWDWTIKVTDMAIIFATIAGPVVAVQAQKWVEHGREVKQRRIAIFQTLMATRASLLSPAHVEAINSIPVQFYGRGGPLKDITDAWKAYIDYLTPRGIPDEVWGPRRMELFFDMLLLISKFLSYSFNKVELMNEVYSPRAHADMQTEQDIIRQGLARVFKGEIALPMDVKSFPTDPLALGEQSEIRVQLLNWLKGRMHVKVRIDEAGSL